jgi:enterochelin esterase-like enzyme
MKKKTNLLLALLFIVAATFAQGTQMPAQGLVKIDSLKSEVLKVYRQYSVYLPKSYATSPGKKYPVLYLLHGVYDNNTGWVQRGHLQDVANKLIDADEAVEMVIIVPDAGRIWNGYFNMDGWPYETFFFTEFLPYIEKTYRIMGDKQHRAISGLSMGGGACTVYAQRHPEMFSSVYAMSALMTLPEVGAIQSNDPKFQALNKTVVANNSLKFVANADDATKEKLRSVRWFVDCGDDDFIFDIDVAFYQEMRNAKIPCQFRVRDGAHTWEYWHSALYTALPFVSTGFAK